MKTSSIWYLPTYMDALLFIPISHMMGCTADLAMPTHPGGLIFRSEPVQEVDLGHALPGNDREDGAGDQCLVRNSITTYSSLGWPYQIHSN